MIIDDWLTNILPDDKSFRNDSLYLDFIIGFGMD